MRDTKTMGTAKLADPVKRTPIEIKDTDGNIVRAFGDDAQQFDGPMMYSNAAGTPYVTLRWKTEDISDRAVVILLNALEVYLTPVIKDGDFLSIEWRVRPTIEREPDHTLIRCRLIVHKRSGRKQDAGIIGIEEGFPSWSPGKMVTT